MKALKYFKIIFFSIKIALELLLLLIVVYAFTNVNMVSYLALQAKGQIKLILNTQKITTILNSPEVSDSIKAKILLIQEIKQFAETNIGIKKSNNYTTFYDQKGSTILWMLTACNKFSFDEYYWEFPILGKTSYKGFFSKEIAQNEASLLNKQLLDTDIGSVSAWSTLGILNDPILSSMFKNNEGQLAELIIHELTHGTIYVSNNVTYNENLASFIGLKGAELFLKSKYKSPKSKALQEYYTSIADEKKLKLFIFNEKQRLDSLYLTFNEQMPIKNKLKLKIKLLYNITDRLTNQTFYNRAIRKRIGDKILKSGNAYFMSYVRYDSKYDEFEKDLKLHNGNLKSYLSSLILKYD